MEIPLPGPAWGLSRYALDPILQRAAVQAGTELLTGMTVADVQAGDGICSIAARSRNGSVSLQARTVIYACGSREGKQPAGEAPTYMGVKAHVAGLAPSGAVELYFFPGGYLGLNEVEGVYSTRPR
ncbi:hypothetical protein N6H14_25265 [Paenibacillus sp. CC-CFT747]|nr:hypothetical protein N6H14_25265 [Paenibacillus sp. CC-CFT747]